MPVKFVSGDPLLTQCQTLGVGHNRAGRTENNPLALALAQRFPVAYANYTRQCKGQKLQAGDVFLWQQPAPRLLFLTVRDSSTGATRLRHVQNCVLRIARDYTYHGIQSLALAPLGEADVWNDIRGLIVNYFEQHALPLVVYEQYQAGTAADETF